MKGNVMSFMANPIVFFIVGILIVIVFAAIYFTGIDPDIFMGFFKGFTPE